MRSAQLGDDAKGALMVASLGDLDESGMGRSGPYPRSGMVIEVARNPDVQSSFLAFVMLPQNLGYSWHLTCSYKEVHFWQFLHQLFGIPLRKTASNHEGLKLAFLLQTGGLQNSVDRFFFCGINEATGINKNDIGLCRIRDNLVATLPQYSIHDFAVHEVPRATETDDADLFRHRVTSLTRPGQRLREVEKERATL